MPLAAAASRSSSFGRVSVGASTQSESKANCRVAVGIRQIVDFEPLDLLADVIYRGQQGGNNDDRFQRLGNGAHFQARKGTRAQQVRNAAIDERHGEIGRRNRGQEAENDQVRNARSQLPGTRQKQGQDDGRKQGNRAQVARRGGPDIKSQEPTPPRNVKTELAFEGETAMGNQIVSGVRESFFAVPVVGRRCAGGLPGVSHGTLRNFDFGVARSLGNILDRVAVGIARREIHSGEIASIPQGLVDETDALKECLPIERGGQAHAGDDVANCDAHGGLLLMFGAHDFVGAGPLRGQSLVEPQQDGPDFGIQIAQTLDELDGKCPIQRLLFKLAQHRCRGDQ